MAEKAAKNVWTQIILMQTGTIQRSYTAMPFLIFLN